MSELLRMTAWDAIGEPAYFSCRILLPSNHTWYELVGITKNQRSVVVSRTVLTHDGFKTVKRILAHDTPVLVEYPPAPDPNSRDEDGDNA